MIREGERQTAILWWRLAGLLGAAVVIVVVPYLITQGGARKSYVAGERVTRSAEIQALTTRIADLTHDSESAMQRLLANEANGYAETSVARAGKIVPSLLENLHSMTSDDLEEARWVERLSAMEHGRLTLIGQALLRFRQGDRTGAEQALRDAGALFGIEPLVERIVDRETQQLQQREQAAQRQMLRNRLTLALAAVAQLLLLAAVVVVSERQIGRRLRAEIREGQAVRRAQMVLQAVREPIALLDQNLCTLLVNVAFGELYGVAEDSPPRRLGEIGQGAWGDEILRQRLSDVLLYDRELWDFELTQRTADGVERHVVVNARRVQQKDSGVPALLMTVSDVTARAMVEQQVKELNHQLESKVTQVSDVNRELETFSYSVSHDLRAPLRHIAGFAQKLDQHLGGGGDDIARHYLGVIRESSGRMAQLIDDLLLFSRLGRGTLRLQPVDMRSLAEDARAMAESEAPDRCIDWRIDALPVVIGDEGMLRTVWQNLIGNAVKYTGQRDDARIEVSVRRDRDGDFEFTVSDNGAGFDMRYVDKLFGIFQRLHKASEFPGNGIGLANVRRIVARHGGHIWAEAELGQGAHFHFTLSAIEPPVTAEGESA